MRRPPLDDVVRLPSAKKKDKAHLCGGKVGRVHEFEWTQGDHPPTTYWVERCTKCGRKGRHCWFWRGYPNTTPCICGHH